MRLFPTRHADVKTMVFVDGENLAIRYGKERANRGAVFVSAVRYEPSVYVWSTKLNNECTTNAKTIRKHYYTSVQGDRVAVDKIVDALREAGIEHPSVFQKKGGQRSKRVDISLATDMLLHACRRDYETAVLIAGDEDYVPLVEAVKDTGCRVFVWFLENGMSDPLRRAADRFANIEQYLF